MTDEEAKGRCADGSLQQIRHVQGKKMEFYIEANGPT